VNTITLLPIYYRNEDEYQKWYSSHVDKALKHEPDLAANNLPTPDGSSIERIRSRVSRGIPTWKFNEQIGFIELGHMDDEVCANVWLDHYMYPYSGTHNPPKNPRFSHTRRPRFEQFEHMAFHFRLDDPFDPLGDNSVADEITYRLKMLIQNYQDNGVFQARTRKIWFDTAPTFNLIQNINWISLLKQ